MLMICLRRITGISRIFFAHRKHGMHRRFYYQRDYTDFPRDPRDPWKQENTPHGNRLISLIMLIVCLHVSRGSARIFSHAKARRAQSFFYQQITRIKQFFLVILEIRGEITHANLGISQIIFVQSVQFVFRQQK